MVSCITFGFRRFLWVVKMVQHIETSAAKPNDFVNPQKPQSGHTQAIDKYKSYFFRDSSTLQSPFILTLDDFHNKI